MPTFNKEECTEQQSFNVEPGEYPFVVFGADNKISKSGNDMISLELHFDIGQEKLLICYEYLVFTPKALYKVKEFCAACGLSDKWESESLDAEDCYGEMGKAKLELGEKNDKGKQYMEVAWFIDPRQFTESPASPSRLSPEEKKKLDRVREKLDAKKQPCEVGETPNYGVSMDDDIPF